MKLKSRLFSVSPLPLAICLAVVSLAQGATLYWDGGTTNIGGTGDGASAGGNGTWNTTLQNWDRGAGQTYVAWPNSGDNAVFAGSAGTVTLGTAISAGNLSISNNNYTIATDAGALTLTGGITTSGSFYHQIAGAGGLLLSGSQPFNITGGLRISTPVSGSGTLTKTGSGFVSFSNLSNGFTGKIIVNEGKFGINGDGALGAVPGSFVADSITLNGGTLVNGIVNGSGGVFDNGGSYTLNANRGITLGSSGGTIQVGYGSGTNLMVAGVVTGSGSLTKTDGGTLTLNGANTYTGDTTVTGGSLVLGNESALGGSTLNYSNQGGSISFGALTSATFGGLKGGQNLTLSNASSAAVTLTVGGNGQSTSYSGVLSGTGGALTKTGSGTLILTGTNTYSGTTTISNGTLQVSSNGTTATLGSGNVINNSALAFNRQNTIAVGNLISGTGTVYQTGSGTLTLSGNNTYSGGTTISAGTVVSGSRGMGSGVVTVASGGTLSVSQSGGIGLAGQYFNVAPSNVGNVNPNFNSLSSLQSHLAGLGQPALALNTTGMNFGSGGASFPSPYQSGASNFESYYSGMINIGTAGTYTFNTSSDDGSVLFVDGVLVVNNNFFQGLTTRTGSIALSAGMHNIAYGFYQGGGGYGFTAQISGANNTTMVDLTTSNAQITPDLVIGSLSGAGNVALTTGNLILGQDNTNQSFSGVISGIGGVNKWGSGTQIFTGTNTYTGGTTISSGIFEAGSNSSFGSGGINFSGNATLRAGANITLSNAITLGTTSDVFDTNGNTLTLSGGISNSAATNNAIKAAGTGTLVLGGALNLTGGGDTDNPALMLGNRNGANFNRGTVTITGTGSLSRISTGWDNTANTLNFASTGTVTMSGDLVTGQSGNGVGVVNHSTGTLTTQNLNLANWDGSYGAYHMSGGTLNTVNLRNGGNGNGNGNSYMLMTGGIVNISSTTTFSRNGNGTNVLNINGSGAQFNAGTNNLNLAFSADSTGIINVNSGLLTVNSNIFLANGGTSSTFGIVNLNGGTARVNSIGLQSGGGNSIVNFNGGTLQALNDNASFMAGLTSANIFSGGATIDTNGKNITIGQNLLAAFGNGVSSVPVAAGGSGYLAAPVVKITGGGGTGATAVAVVSGGVVTGIQITSAGTGYTSAPTVTLVGGGATTAATLGTVATAANASGGGLMKIGAGTLTLGGVSTYTGATSVNTGSLQLTGSLSNSAISVASGARFSPTVTTSAGLSSGSAGASLTLSAGSILDMSSASAGTINTFTLNPGSNTFAGQTLSLAGANLRFDLGSSSADRLTVNSGTATVTGMNNIRFNTGSSMTTGSRTLISAASGLAGNFQFEGGSSLGISAQQQIKNIGGTYYRLTLENSNTTQQVVVSAAPSNVINIMPLGSSITAGIASEQGGANTYAGGGYRSQLYQNLVNDGRFTPHLVGSATDLNKRDSSKYNILEGANELSHEGHAGYTTTQILKNLSANGGDGGNNGGFWLQSGNGVNPDYVTLSIGGNDYGANGSETTGPLKRTDAIVSQLQSLRPDSHIIVSNLFYRTQTAGGNSVGDLQNAYYNPGVQAMVFNHVLAGQHVSFYDAYSAITPGNNMANIFDGIHPDQAGYNALANGWYDALANGSAFWTGSSGGTWSSPANFAQNYQLTTTRQTALGALTDVHFNSNASPLGTTLGQNTTVRGVNFAAGATGAITIGGANTLTLGAGGITVQAGTGAHVISSNIGLGASQTWGNVSSNPLTVTGNIGGSASLNLVGSYTVELPGSLVGSTYTTTTQTVTGTGGFVLNGANTHSGGTTINAVTVGIGHNTALGTGTVAMNNGATLSNSSSNALTVGNAFAFGPTGSMKFVANNDLTMTGGFSGGAGGVQINVQGPGTLTLSDTARTVGSGATPAVWTVSGGGTLALTRGNNLGTLPAAAAAQIILDNGTFSTVTAGGNFFPERGLQVNAAGGTWHDAAGGIEFTGAVLNNGPFTANTAVSNATSTLSGVVSGSGSLIKTGAGSLALTAANTYTGAITINAGSLVVGAAGANDGSTSALGAANTGKAITVGTGATLTGTVNNWFGNQTNAGTLPTITVNGGTLSTTRYTTLGGLTLNGATVTNAATDGGNYQSFAFRGNVTVGGSSASTMSATAATGTSQGYHLGSNTIFNVADATGNADADLIVSAPLRDQSGDFANAAGGLTKNGGGTLMLGGVNTYTGATAVNAGTLTISGSIENSAVTVSNPGTTIASGATGTLGSSLTVNSGAILAAGGAAADGIATVTGGTILMSGSIFSWDISSNGLAYDKLMTASLAGDGSQESVVFRIVAADSSFSDSFWNQSRSWSDIFTTNGTSATAISNWANLFNVAVVNSSYQPITPVNGSFSVSGSALTWSAVPEPSNAVVGLLLASSLLRRRRTAGAPARTTHSRV